jgi:hypothetical protein
LGLASWKDQLTSWLTSRPLGVKSSLQEQRRGGLVYRLAAGARVMPPSLQSRVGENRGESLIDQPDWHGRNPRGQCPGECPALRCRLALAPGEAHGQADHDLDCRVPGDQLGQFRKIARAAPHGVERRGEQPARIAPGHANPDRSDIDSEPDAGPHGLIPAVICLIEDTVRQRHDFTLRHPRPLCRE